VLVAVSEFFAVLVFCWRVHIYQCSDHFLIFCTVAEAAGFKLDGECTRLIPTINYVGNTDTSGSNSTSSASDNKASTTVGSTGGDNATDGNATLISGDGNLPFTQGDNSSTDPVSTADDVEMVSSSASAAIHWGSVSLLFMVSFWGLFSASNST